MEGKEEKAKVDEELVRSRDEILVTLDSIGDAVISTDSKGNVVFMNPVAEDLTGWKEEESVGKNIKKIFHIVNEETGDEVENPVIKVLKDGLIAGLANHTILIAKDGSRIPIDDSGAPVRDKDGNITGVVLIFRDITERRNAEKAIQQKTHELGERVKELNCLYGISSLKIIPEITIDEFLAKAIELLPPSWQYPEITTARIIFEGKEFITDNFRESSWKQSAEIKLSRKKAGMIEVFYLKEKPESYEGPFLKEERDLINSLAESIGAFIHLKLQKDQEEKERKKAEQELEQTIDLSLDFVGVAGFDAYFKRINPTFSRVLGYTEEELLSTPFLEFVHLDDRESTLAEVGKLTEGVKTLSFTNRYRCKDGSYRWLEWHSNPIIEEEIMYFVARDITEHKQAKDELIESEEKFHKFFSTIPDAAFINDQDTGKIIDVNEAAVKLYGYSRDEWLKMKNTDVSTDPEKTRIATKSPPAHIPIRYHRKKDGTIFPIEMTVGFYKMNERNVVFATGRDISERLKIQNELQKQRDELESFSSTVSHDLKGRLAILMALADIEQTEYSEIMIDHIEDLSKLIENLLLLAKKGEILGELSPVNLNELLEKIVKNISTADPDLKIIIQDLPILNSDPTKLTQVFENILMNVLKHAKATKVEIYAEEDKKEHIIHIRDNGIGMTKKKQDEIRESWKTRKYKSFGILIVLKIVEAHNGKLVLTSKKGKGTTISIHFPKK